jgi:cation-transporting P-type ATPase E
MESSITFEGNRAVSTSSSARTTEPSSPTYQGLSSAEIDQRRREGASNDYQARVNRTYWDIFRDNVLNLFNIVLFTLLFIVLLFRDYGTVIFAGFSVVSNTFLGAIQEAQAKRRLDQLATLSQQTVRVMRGGEVRVIGVREVVKDDVILLEPGTKAVVDGTVLHSDSLEMDESLITGESDAVYKTGEDTIYGGSFCVAGTGIMRATKVGKASTVSQLSEIAREYQYIRTPTQKRIDIIVELSIVVMLVFVPMLLVANLLVTQPPLTLLQAVRNAVVFITTLVPQGLVLTAVLSLTIGAIKISQQETLVQKVNAVESLGNATVLCFDKTGTLTENRLAVDAIIMLDDETTTAAVHQHLADYLGALAHRNRTAHAIQTHVSQQASPRDRTKTREMAFTSQRQWGAIQFDDQIYIMGAPERIFSDADLIEQARTHSQRGQRVLAFGLLDCLPTDDHPQDVRPLALITLSDQLRPNIDATLQAFRDENIRLMVISGDHLNTVSAIAEQAGISADGALAGDSLDAMSDSDLRDAVRQTQVFARIAPYSKRRIVQALQANDDYVAMIGDGVNDVPALKQANLAIVMNDGTQISKDIADIVLLNNALSTLPLAFHEGTRITQSIFGTMKLFLIRGGHHVLTFFCVLFMGLPFPLTPIQISWATFASVNIGATLLATGIIRPQRMDNFRRDVLDPIIIGGFVGAVALTSFYVIVYLGTGRDLALSRSALTLLVIAYNGYIAMLIQGVDVRRVQTIWQQRRIIGLIILLAGVAVVAVYIQPPIFEFTRVTAPWIFALMATTFALAVLVLTLALHNRYILDRFWALVSPSDERVAQTVDD